MASLLITVTIAANILLAVLGTIGNGVMILAFIRRREIRTLSNYFNLVTFINGIGISAVAYPWQAFVDSLIILKNPECLLAGCCITGCGIAFTLSLLALTVERYVSICYPLTAPTILTPRRVSIGMASIYIYSVLASFIIPYASPMGIKGPLGPIAACRLFIPYPRYYAMFLMLNMMTPIPFLLIIYGKIFVVIRRHVRSIASLPLSVRERVTGDATDALTATSYERRRRNRELKSALFLFILIVSFVVCWLPFTVFLFNGTRASTSPLAFSLYHALLYLYAVINPFLYGFGNKSYRAAVMAMLRPPCAKPKPQTPTQTLNIGVTIQTS